MAFFATAASKRTPSSDTFPVVTAQKKLCSEDYEPTSQEEVDRALLQMADSTTHGLDPKPSAKPPSKPEALASVNLGFIANIPIILLFRTTHPQRLLLVMNCMMMM